MYEERERAGSCVRRYGSFPNDDDDDDDENAKLDSYVGTISNEH